MHLVLHLVLLIIVSLRDVHPFDMGRIDGDGFPLERQNLRKRMILREIRIAARRSLAAATLRQTRVPRRTKAVLHATCPFRPPSA